MTHSHSLNKTDDKNQREIKILNQAFSEINKIVKNIKPFVEQKKSVTDQLKNYQSTFGDLSAQKDILESELNLIFKSHNQELDEKHSLSEAAINNNLKLLKNQLHDNQQKLNNINSIQAAFNILLQVKEKKETSEKDFYKNLALLFEQNSVALKDFLGDEFSNIGKIIQNYNNYYNGGMLWGYSNIVAVFTNNLNNALDKINTKLSASLQSLEQQHQITSQTILAYSEKMSQLAEVSNNLLENTEHQQNLLKKITQLEERIQEKIEYYSSDFSHIISSMQLEITSLPTCYDEILKIYNSIQNKYILNSFEYTSKIFAASFEKIKQIKPIENSSDVINIQSNKLILEKIKNDLVALQYLLDELKEIIENSINNHEVYEGLINDDIKTLERLFMKVDRLSIENNHKIEPVPQKQQPVEQKKSGYAKGVEFYVEKLKSLLEYIQSGNNKNIDTPLREFRSNIEQLRKIKEQLLQARPHPSDLQDLLSQINHAEKNIIPLIQTYKDIKNLIKNLEFLLNNIKPQLNNNKLDLNFLQENPQFIEINKASLNEFNNSIKNLAELKNALATCSFNLQVKEKLRLEIERVEKDVIPHIQAFYSIFNIFIAKNPEVSKKYDEYTKKQEEEEGEEDEEEVKRDVRSLNKKPNFNILHHLTTSENLTMKTKTSPQDLLLDLKLLNDNENIRLAVKKTLAKSEIEKFFNCNQSLSLIELAKFAQLFDEHETQHYGFIRRRGGWLESRELYTDTNTSKIICSKIQEKIMEIINSPKNLGREEKIDEVTSQNINKLMNYGKKPFETNFNIDNEQNLKCYAASLDDAESKRSSFSRFFERRTGKDSRQKLFEKIIHLLNNNPTITELKQIQVTLRKTEVTHLGARDGRWNRNTPRHPTIQLPKEVKAIITEEYNRDFKRASGKKNGNNIVKNYLDPKSNNLWGIKVTEDPISNTSDLEKTYGTTHGGFLMDQICSDMLLYQQNKSEEVKTRMMHNYNILRGLGYDLPALDLEYHLKIKRNA